MNRATAAALAANTFTQRAVQVEDFRCYVQLYEAGKPWTAEENLWEEVLAPSHKLNIGVVIFPSVDISPATHYKMMPFGDIEPTIRDYHGCGVSNLPTGGSLEWRFDHIVHFATDKVEASFIVVKVPGSPPPTMWNGSASAQPEIQTSADVEKLVRAKFFVRPNEKMDKPCWLDHSIVKSERDSWKMAANAGDAMYKTLFENYVGLQEDFLKQAIDMDELQDKHNEVVHQHLEVQKQNSKITHQFFDIQKAMKELQVKHDEVVHQHLESQKAMKELEVKHEEVVCQRLELASNNFDIEKAMKELQEKHNALVQEQVQRRTDNQEMATALYDIHKATECCICFEPLSDGAPCSMGLPCGHVFHAACHEKQRKKNVCAHCQTKVTSWREFHGFTAISAILKKFKFPELPEQ